LTHVFHLIGDAAIWVAFMAAVAFCATYAVVAPWRRSAEGWHLMTFTAVIGIAFAWIGLRLILGPIPVEIPRAVILSALAALLVWRLLLLIRTQIRTQIRRRKRMTEEFVPPPANEPVPPVGPSDKGAPDAPDPDDDGIVYADPLEAEK
jgi:hypothetical protein